MPSLVRLQAAGVFGAQAGVKERLVELADTRADSRELSVAGSFRCFLREREQGAVARHEQGAGAFLVDPRVGVVWRRRGELLVGGAPRPECRTEVATIFAPAEIGGAEGRVVTAGVGGCDQDLRIVILPQSGD